MSVKKLSENALTNFVDNLLACGRVEGVQAVGEKFAFRRLESAGDLRLDYDVSLLPPKKYFQPPVETLMTFEMPGAYESYYENEKFVLIGVHPYDMIAINQMDQLFSQDNYDSHYMKLRDNVTIIAVDVVTASKNVFASSMGTATVEKGYDILLTKVDDGYVAEAGTDKGESLLATADKAVEAGKEDLKKRQDVWERNRQGLNNHDLKCEPSELGKLLEGAYEHPVWEEKARTCFSCGSCNMVCPTCYCFNVRDEVNWDMKTGKRERSWDGCVLDGFTKVAGDHEFRTHRADRLRHRLYRKGKYVPDKIGCETACVGCGRCVGACLPDIANPVSVYNRLLDDINVGQ